MNRWTGCIGIMRCTLAGNSWLIFLRPMGMLLALLLLTSCSTLSDAMMDVLENNGGTGSFGTNTQTEVDASPDENGQTSSSQTGTSPLQNASLKASEMPRTVKAKPLEQVGFSEDDFSVPQTSKVAITSWQAFIAEKMDHIFEGDSRREGLHEVFRFESSLVEDEETVWHVSYSVATISHIPGWSSKDITKGMMVHEITMKVHEDGNRLFLKEMTFHVNETVVPERVLQSLRTAMRNWRTAWDRAIGTASEAVPTTHERVRAIPFNGLTEGFAPPQSGEISVDLTGTGVQEIIHLAFEEDGDWKMEVNGVQVEGVLHHPVGAYALDLDERDRQREVALSGFSDKGELITLLYTFRKDHFLQVGAVPGHLFDGNGMGRISSWTQSLHGPFEGKPHRLEFILDANGEIRMVPARWYQFDLEVGLKADLPLFLEPDSERAGIVLPEGSLFRIELGDVANWFRLVNATGETGWIHFVNETEIQLPDGEVVQAEQVMTLQEP